jgi:hypothetical protein
MIRLIPAVILTVFLFQGFCFAQDLRATTEDGRKVILKNDGTYLILETTKASSSRSQGSYQKPEKATAVSKPKGDKFLVWYDPTVWREEDPSSSKKPGFVHKDGDIQAVVIAERVEMSIEALRELAINNARHAAPDAKVTYEDNRWVNGKNMLCMKIEGTVKGARFVYWSYYYAGKAGVIQHVTFAPANLFPEYESEMTSFLNGLVINE